VICGVYFSEGPAMTFLTNSTIDIVSDIEADINTSLRSNLHFVQNKLKVEVYPSILQPTYVIIIVKEKRY
jgi:hypothetical protein